MKKSAILFCAILIVCASCKKNTDDTSNNIIIDAPICDAETLCELDCQKPDNETTKRVLQLLVQNESNGAYIINQYLRRCHLQSELTKTEQIEAYIEPGCAKNDLDIDEAYPFLDTLFSLSVVTHEMSHALEASMSTSAEDCCERETMMKLFINDATTINIEYTKVVSAQEIGKIVPIYFQENGFYGLYIGSGMHDCAISGIYGLMSEFHAYYQNTYYAFENIDTLLDLYNASNNNIYLKALTYGVESSYLTYYDFKYYQLAYLDYCRQYVPEVYTAIKQNDAFWEAFDLIDGYFGRIIDDYLSFLSDNQQINAYSYHNDNTEYINRITQEIEKTKTALSM